MTYQQNAVVLDTLSADPQLVKAIANLPPGEVFVIPQGGALLFNALLRGSLQGLVDVLDADRIDALALKVDAGRK